MQTSYEEVVQERKERLGRKAERFKTFSEHAHESAEEHREKSDRAISGIPFGQPILIGHHSQRRHERALERSWDHADKAISEQKRADKWERRAEHAENLLDRMENSKPYVSNKIEEAERDIRLWERRIKNSDLFIRLHDAGKLTDLVASACGFSLSAIDSARQDNERAKRELPQAIEKRDYWKKKLQDLGGLFDASTLQKGDMINTTAGKFPVKSVNKKSVTVTHWLTNVPESQGKIPFSCILGKVE